MQKRVIFVSELASRSEIGSQIDLIPCGGCVFGRTQLNPSTTFISSVTGKQFTLSLDEIPRNNACTTKNVIYLIMCDKCCMQYVGVTTTGMRTRFSNHRPCINKRNILLYDHFCGPDHDISDCKVQIIFQLEPGDNDAKDVMLAKRNIQCGCSLHCILLV